MENKQIDVDKTIKHWAETSDDDFATMLILYYAKSYHWALFLGHIAVEKLLKACFVKKNGTHPPFTHNLYRLAELSNLELSEEQAEWLYRITTFNLNARYDDYKKEFYALCTPEFTEEWINKIKKLQLWIKQML
jgi:HEPN domain-containing protein